LRPFRLMALCFMGVSCRRRPTVLPVVPPWAGTVGSAISALGPCSNPDEAYAFAVPVARKVPIRSSRLHHSMWFSEVVCVCVCACVCVCVCVHARAWRVCMWVCICRCGEVPSQPNIIVANIF
jgi:hypothetical protein